MENKNSLLLEISQACADLLYPSETNAPFMVSVVKKNGSFTEKDACELVEAPGDAHVETVTLEHFFRNVAVEKDWHDEARKKNVQRFAHLAGLITEKLSNVTVYRVGTIAIDAVIAGKANEDEWVVICTKLVET